MKTLNLPLHRKARIWFAELPQAEFAADETYEIIMPGAKSPPNNIRRAAVELLIPTGPRAMYGLLGGVLSPSGSNKMHIQVNVSRESGLPLVDSLASSLDKVSIGLPKEYVPGLVNGIFKATRQIGGLSSGKVLFNCAAHGYVGSSELIFMHLSSIVIKILSAYSELPSEQEMIALLQAELSSGK
jgi:hypothetical protein